MDKIEYFLIWSFDHNAWWKPDERGYTEDLIDAGLYSFQDAKRIVVGANEYSDVPKEAMVPSASIQFRQIKSMADFQTVISDLSDVFKIEKSKTP